MPSLLADLSPLRTSADLRRLMLPGTISMLGSEITGVAAAFQIFEITRSTFAVGLLGLCALVPVLTVSFLGGALADARDRRTVALWALGALACTSALLAVNTLVGPSLVGIYALWTANICLFSIQRPAVDAMIPRLVPPEQLTATSALGGLMGSLGMMVGPAIAGLLLATVDVAGAYALDAATFLVAFVGMLRIRPVPVADDAEPVSLRGVLDGFRFLRGRQVLQATYLIDTVAMVFGMPLALFPAVAAERFGGSTRALGLLYAAPALGSFIVSATSGWTGRVHRHGVAFVVAAACWGLAVVGFGFTEGLVLSLVALAAAGGADMVSGVFRMTMWNRIIPDSHRGRLSGITWANVASGPALGDLEAGTVARFTSVTTSIVSGGVLCVAGVLATALWLRPVLRYDDREPTA